MGASEAIRNPRSPQSIGDLLGSVWQIGYVTSDLDRACESLERTLGISDFAELPAREATYLENETVIEPWQARFAVATKGDLVIELAQPVAGAVDFYRRALPADGSFAVRFHHVAVSVPDGDAEWERIRSLLRAAGFTFDHGVAIPDRMRAAYVDTTSHLGHMIEICQMTAATRAHYLELLGPDSAPCR